MTLNSWLFCLQAPKGWIPPSPHPTLLMLFWSSRGFLQDGENLTNWAPSPALVYGFILLGRIVELLIESCYRFKWTFNDIKKQNKGNIRFNIHFCFQLNFAFLFFALMHVWNKMEKKIRQVSLKISEILKYLVLGLEIIWYDCWLSGFGVD